MLSTTDSNRSRCWCMQFVGWDTYMEFFGLSGDKALQETEEPQEHVITAFSKDSIRIIHRLPWRDGLDTEVPFEPYRALYSPRSTPPSMQHTIQPYRALYTLHTALHSPHNPPLSTQHST